MRAVLVALGAGALATAVAVALFWLFVIPWPWDLDARNPEATALMEQRVREAAASGSMLSIRQQWVALDRISPNLVRAVIVAEDHRFREHAGVDWRALAEEVRWDGSDRFRWWSPADLVSLGRAVGYSWRNRDEIRGRSTITQQLAKNLYFGTERSFMRKGLELVAARRLERALTKDRILELYLNLAEWGPGIFGAEAASLAYFGQGADALTLEEGAALAATLPHPLTSNPALSPAQMRWRQALILERLAPPQAGAPRVELPLPLPLPPPVLMPGPEPAPRLPAPSPVSPIR